MSLLALPKGNNNIRACSQARPVEACLFTVAFIDSCASECLLGVWQPCQLKPTYRCCRAEQSQRQQDIIRRLHQQLQDSEDKYHSVRQEAAANADHAADALHDLAQLENSHDETRQKVSSLVADMDANSKLDLATIRQLQAANDSLQSDRDRLTSQLREAMSYRALSIRQQNNLTCVGSMLSSSAARFQHLRHLQLQASSGNEAASAQFAAGLDSLVSAATDGSVPAEQVETSTQSAQLVSSMLGSCQEVLQHQQQTLSQVRREREHFKIMVTTSKLQARRWHAAWHSRKSRSKGQASVAHYLCMVGSYARLG